MGGATLPGEGGPGKGRSPVVSRPDPLLTRLTHFLFVFALLGVASGSAYAKEDEAIVILSTRTLQEMQQVRKLIEEKGGRIKDIFVPSVFIGTIPQTLIDELRSLSEIADVSYEAVHPGRYRSDDLSTLHGIEFWNRSLEAPTARPSVGREEPFRDNALIPPDLPKTEEEKRQKEEEYLRHWELKRQELLLQEERKKQKSRKPGASLSPSISMFLPFSQATGAGFFDTSLYLAGDIAVGIFFQPGSAGSWTPPEIDSVFDSVVAALNRFSTEDEPNARITLVPVKEVDGSGIPNVPPSAANERTYVNDLRNTHQTQWAYMITMFKGAGRANAYLFGPSTRLYSYDLRGGETTRHETMHIFGAADQYCPDACTSPITRWGYLQGVNANAETNDGNGFFAGAGEGRDDLMIGPVPGAMNPIGVYSRGQVGWRDSDGDGILETLDTFPDSVIESKTGTNPFTYTGKASDRPLPSHGFILGEPEQPTFNSVSLNTITSVEYRMNGGAWVSATPQDGLFDSGVENFTFTTPFLSDNTYTVEVRATNSVGNTEISYATDQIAIAGSGTSNVSPFGSFSVNPPFGSTQTTFTADASLSSDIDQAPTLLQVRWDFENDGIWDTPFSQTKTILFSYSTAGLKTIRLEVQDIEGLTDTVTGQVDVASSDRAPNAFFTTTPENQHKDTERFGVTFDASGSIDGEDPAESLQVRWDFENDGTWDTAYSSQKIVSHDYQLPVRPPTLPPLEVSATTFPTLSDARGVQIVGSFAYVAARSSGLQIIDISNPASPASVKSCNTPGEAVRVSVSGNYAYVADAFAGLQICDLSDPAPISIPVGGLDTWSAQGVSVSGDYAYIADYDGGLRIVDISTPSNPTLVTTHNSPQIIAWGVYVSGNYAYIAAGASGLRILDVTNPASPFVVRDYNPSGFGYARDVVLVGTYAYVAADGSGLQIIDISTPSNPLSVARYASAVIWGVHVLGNFAYVAAGDSGVLILDVNNPAFPALIGRYDTSGFAYGVYSSGAQAYVADGTSGLQIVTLSSRLSLAASYATSSAARDVQVVGNTAYVIDSNSGIYILDITDPSIPTLLGRSFVRGTAVSVSGSGTHAYVADPVSDLYIVDISDPSGPIVGVFATPGAVQDVQVVGDYAYVTDEFSGLYILDVSVPTAPILEGRYPISGITRGIHVAGDYAYLAIDASGLLILNITNPAAPSFAGSYDTPGSARAVHLVGNHAFVADGSSGGLQILDVSDPLNPAPVGSYNTPGIAADVYAVDNYAFVADWTSGLQIFDVTNPSAPTFIGSYSTPGPARAVYVSGNHAYVADHFSGLQIVRLMDLLKVPAMSKHWRAKMEVKDTANQTAQATRDLWVVSYNHPPIFDRLEGGVGTAFAPVGFYDTPGIASDVFVSGNYAFVTDQAAGFEPARLQQFDVSNPGSPQKLASYDYLYSPKAVFVSGNLAYVADDYNGLQILGGLGDSIFPPFLVGGYSEDFTFISDVFVSGIYAYLTEGYFLKIVRIDTPNNPVLVRNYSAPFSSSVFVSGAYAYVAVGASGLQIIDISNPSNPTPFTTTVDTPGTASGVYVLNGYAYVADRESGLQIINISDPTNPLLDGSFDTEGIVTGVFVSGNYAYVTDSYAGLQIIDVSDPSDPTLVGNYDSPGNAAGVFVSGTHAYFADGSSGLWVVSSEGARVVRGFASDPDIGTTWDGLVEYRWDLNTDGVWDTPFSTIDYKTVPAPVSSIVCEARDRFNATSRKSDRAPVLSSIWNRAVNEGQTLQFTLFANDPENDTLSFSSQNIPRGATLTENGNGKATFSWTPNFSQAGSYLVTFVVSDGVLQNAKTITIAVADVPGMPSGGGSRKRPIIL